LTLRSRTDLSRRSWVVGCSLSGLRRGRSFYRFFRNISTAAPKCTMLRLAAAPVPKWDKWIRLLGVRFQTSINLSHNYLSTALHLIANKPGLRWARRICRCMTMLTYAAARSPRLWRWSMSRSSTRSMKQYLKLHIQPQ
jgi:hypothetical protein